MQLAKLQLRWRLLWVVWHLIKLPNEATAWVVKREAAGGRMEQLGRDRRAVGEVRRGTEESNRAQEERGSSRREEQQGEECEMERSKEA